MKRDGEGAAMMARCDRRMEGDEVDVRAWVEEGGRMGLGSFQKVGEERRRKMCPGA